MCRSGTHCHYIDKETPPGESFIRHHSLMRADSCRGRNCIGHMLVDDIAQMSLTSMASDRLERRETRTGVIDEVNILLQRKTPNSRKVIIFRWRTHEGGIKGGNRGRGAMEKESWVRNGLGAIVGRDTEEESRRMNHGVEVMRGGMRSCLDASGTICGWEKSGS